MEVELETLRRLIGLALDELEANVGSAVQLDSDYFWSVPLADRGDVTTEPPELTVGQISEVIGHLNALEIEPETVTFMHMQWISQLLSSIVQSRTGSAGEMV